MPTPADDVPDLLTGLATTRAIRRYRDEPIPEDDLAGILWHATRAPSGSNRQPFRFVVLRDGVTLNDGPTLPARARCIDPPALWPRDPPVRFRKTVPDAWLELCIREGRNRQIRRMTAAVGLPTLRLVRWSVGDWTLDGIAPGEWRKG